jgi:uncharacterized protein (DUF433 family)
MPEAEPSSPGPNAGDASRIVLDPHVLTGKPIVRGTRISVELVLGLLAGGWTFEEVLQNYPMLTREDLLACLRYAHERVLSERVFPVAG